MFKKLLSGFVDSCNEELEMGMLSSPLAARVEQLLSAGRRFARGASIAAVIAISVGLAGTMTVSSHTPAWIAYAQAPPPAIPAASADPQSVDPPTLTTQMLRDVAQAQAKQLKAARAELEKAKVQLAAQKIDLEWQAKMLEAELAKLRLELSVKATLETRTLRRDLDEMRKQIEQIVRELQPQR